MLSCVRLFATPWTIAHQVPLSMEFSRQESWSGLPFPTPGDLPHPGTKPTSPASAVLAGRFFTTGTTGEVSNSSVQFSSVAHLCPTLCDPMNLSTPGLPVHHQLLEFTQTHEVSIGAANRQISLQRASLLTQMVKNSPAMRGPGLHPWVGKISWRREWLPTPIFLPGEFQGQRRLVGYSPWGHKMWDMTEQLSLFFAKKLTFLKFFGLFFKIVKR